MSNFAQQWAWELQASLQMPPTSHHVLLSLAEHLNDSTETAWPTLERICSRTGLSVRAVRNAIRRLQEMGVVTVEPRTTRGGRKIGNVYRLPGYDPVWARERKAAGFDHSGNYDPALVDGLNSIIDPPEPVFRSAESTMGATAF